MMEAAKDLKNILFKKDKHKTENNVFQLHHRVNFIIILVGVTVLLAQNYLNENAITCKGGDDYDKAYCWLHGGGQLPPKLAKAASGCVAEQRRDDMGDEKKEELDWRNKRITSYYIWMPYVLILCAALAKLPRFLWKTFGERGVTESVMQFREDSVKMGERAVKLLDDSYRSKFFVLSFTFCEFLNIVTMIINFIIIDTLLDGQFWSYGSKVIDHMSEEKKVGNPMCTVFPTEISCDVSYGGATGGTDNDNILCLLSNNAFNQHYFFVLWIWWTALLVLSGLTFIYSLIRLSVPQVSTLNFKRTLSLHGVDLGHNQLNGLSHYDFYLLGRIASNLKGSEIQALVNEVGARRQRSAPHVVVDNKDEKQPLKSNEMEMA